MRFTLLALLVWLGSTAATAQSDTRWTLEKCIEHALANNLTVKQTALVAQISKNDNLQSKLNLLPGLDASAAYNFNFGNSLNPVTYSYVQSNSQSGQAQLQGNIVLFNGLQQIHNIERTRYELQASEFDLRTAQNNTALSVSQAFLQVVLNSEILKVAEKQKELTAAQKTNIESRIRSGQLAENALFDVESQLARDEANIVNAKGALDIATLTLKQLLQLNNQTPFEVDVPPLNADNFGPVTASNASGIFDFAVNNQPSVLAAAARVKSADASRKIALGGITPTLAAFGSLSSGYFSQDQRLVRFDTATFTGIYEKVPFQDQMKNNFRKVAGISLSFPIFGKAQRFTNISNARLQYQIRNLQLESSKNALRQDIEQAYVNARTAAENYLANKKSAEAAQRAFDNLSKRFGAGLANTFELQQAKNTLAAAESQMAQAKFTYIFRLKVLDFYQGKPITLN